MTRALAFPILLVAVAGCAGSFDAPGAGSTDRPTAARAPAPIEQRDLRVPRPSTQAPAVTASARPSSRSTRAAAPVDQRAMATRPPAADAGVPAAPRAHPAQPSPDWAAAPGTPLSAYALQPNEAQPFDPLTAPRAHTVAEGETLYALSARYQVPLRALIDANGLEAPFGLAVGQPLKIPPPRTVTVQRGETLTVIATRYAVDMRSLGYLNRLAPPYEVRPGDRLVVPGLARPPQRAPAAEPPPPQEPTPRGVKAKPSVKFAWPLKGKVMARFGVQPNGLRSDGIDIAAKPGAPVRAAAAGDVVYAGDDLPGYGPLVLVKHADGWVTAYARTQRIVAKEGMKVRQGDVIAEAGDKLHFQVRRGAEPADPLAALPPV